MTGTGTSSDPFVVANADDLNAVRNNLSANYIMSADIDMNNSIWNKTASKSFTPIGDDTTQFTGVFDGNGHTIANFYIGGDLNQSNVGLFGRISGSTTNIKNLILDSPYILSTHNNNFMGCLIGRADMHTNVTNCRINNGYIKGNLFVGLFAGYNQGDISYSKVNGGTLIGAEYSGGFCGDSDNNTPTPITMKECCVSNSNITIGATGTGDTAGSFIGYVSANVIIQDCYSTATINAGACSGGFVGILIAQQGYTPNVTRTFYAGRMNDTSTDRVGGWCSDDSASTPTVTNSYWDTQVSTKTTSKYGIGKTTAQMQTQSTFTTYDFTNVWGINSGEYPYLRNCEKAIPILPIGGEEPTTPTYKQDYHNLNSPLFGTFSPLF